MYMSMFSKIFCSCQFASLEILSVKKLEKLSAREVPGVLLNGMLNTNGWSA